MRNIKYRAWDKEDKKMLYNTDLCLIENSKMTSMRGLILTGIGFNKLDCISKDLILMQYTGLKDNKRTKEYPEGQEIYEGDIVRFLDDMRYIISKEQEYLVGEVRYIDSAFWCFYEDEENLTRLVSVMVDYWSEELKGNQCEIIGNIKENPQLLEKK